MKMPVNVIKFSKDYGLEPLFEAFKDFYNHARSNEGVVGLSFSTVDATGKTISFTQKNDILNKMFIDSVAKTAGVDPNIFGTAQYASNPNVKWASFAIVDALIDYVLPDSIIQSIGMYTDTRVAGFGDSFKFDVKPRDLFPVTRASRGKRIAELQRQFNGTVSVVPENHMVSVSVSLYRVLSGHESIGDFVMKAIRSIEVEMTKDVYTAFNTAMGSLPTSPAGGELAFTGYSQENLVKLVQRVTAWNQGAKATILGTQLALQNILPSDANYRYFLTDEYVTLGYVREFAGADVVLLPQVADWKTPFKMVLDDTKIYVVSPGQQKIVKLCLEGQTLSSTDDVYANANLTQNSTLSKSWAASVVTSSVAGLITLA